MLKNANETSVSFMTKNNHTKKTNKLVLFSILRHNSSKFVTQTGLYCSKQLETTFNQFGKNRCISPSRLFASSSAVCCAIHAEHSLRYRSSCASHRRLLAYCQQRRLKTEHFQDRESVLHLLNISSRRELNDHDECTFESGRSQHSQECKYPLRQCFCYS